MAHKFKCGKCGEFIVVRWMKSGENAKCRKCGEETVVPEDALEVADDVATEYLKPPSDSHKYKADTAYQEKSGVAEHTPLGPNAILTRYDSAYKVAKSIIGHGEAVKVSGIVLGVIIVVISLVVGIIDKNFLYLISGGVLAAIVGMVLNASGTILMAQGQILLASLDSAVNTSPLINNSQKSKIMEA